MASSASSAQTLDPELLIHLNPCPYCADKIITYVGRRGRFPVTRFYKCCHHNSGDCSFYEWQPVFADRLEAAGVDISACWS